MITPTVAVMSERECAVEECIAFLETEAADYIDAARSCYWKLDPHAAKRWEDRAKFIQLSASMLRTKMFI